ncbi:PKD domain-containing protein [Tenacibaculum xiamenense]|uniref:PKD domain-containing protein n=1 Tax=Tenacibaculum xiamenense TaxID=1261553 RepID=UPI003892DC1E
MNQVDFTKPGGFPLEQNTLARLQTAYKDEFFMTFKKHLGLEENKNYLLYPATNEEQGWLIIKGNLIQLLPSLNTSNYVKITETHEALVFRSGAKHKVFIDRKAEYVSEIPAVTPIPLESEDQSVYEAYYSISDFEKVTNIPDLGNIYLPLDGSSAMSGNLNLGGYKLSALDVMEHPQAIIRSQELKIGHSETRGKVYPDTPLGRALVDVGGVLSVNHEADWENIQIDGAIKLPELTKDSSGNKHPILIDEEGNLTRSNGSFIGSIVLGMIALWHQEEIPHGWVICDGYLGRKVNGFTIPDMRSEFFENVRYIMYVGDFNRYPLVNAGKDLNIELPWTLGKEFITLSGTATDEDGTIAKQLWSYTSIPSGLNCTIESPESLQTNVRNLEVGNYVFKLTAWDQEGLEWSDEVKVQVTQNQAPIIQRIEGITSLSVKRGTTGTQLTVIASDPEGRSLQYQWTNANGTVISNQHVVSLSGLGIGNHSYKVKVIDDRGFSSEKAIIVSVSKTKIAPKVNAGSDLSIQLPTNQVTLYGNASDENHDSLSYQWTKIAGGNASIISPNNSATAVQNLQQGNYTFRLTATDSDGLTGYDDVAVQVKQPANVNPTVSNISIVQIPNKPGHIRISAIGNDPDGNNGNLKYHWTISGAIPNPGNVSSFEVNRYQIPVGLYDFKVYVTDERGGQSNTAIYEDYAIIKLRIATKPNNLDNQSIFDLIIEGPPNYGDDNIKLNASFHVYKGGGMLTDLSSSGLGMFNHGDSKYKVFADMSSSGRITLPMEIEANLWRASSVEAKFSIRGMGASVGAVSIGPKGGGGPIDVTCFCLNSKVPLVNGSIKTLREIQEGDVLKGVDFDNRIDASDGDYYKWRGNLLNARSAEVKVRRKSVFISDHYYEIVLENEQIVKVTEGHPLLTSITNENNEVQWVKPMDLQKLMYLVDEMGMLKKIETIIRINEEIEVGVLDVESVDNFIISGIVAHNAEIGDNIGDIQK